MFYTVKNILQSLRIQLAAFAMLLAMLFPAQLLIAQETKVANIELSFNIVDSVKICKASVRTSDNKPVIGPEVHLYAKRMYTLLPVGKVVATDSSGVAEIEFPSNLPGDKFDMITVIAKIEKDEVYGNVEKQAEVKWGVKAKLEGSLWGDRSLSASREKAPMVLLVVSSLIIILIWGTLFYIVAQLFRISKSRHINKEMPANTA